MRQVKGSDLYVPMEHDARMTFGWARLGGDERVPVGASLHTLGRWPFHGRMFYEYRALDDEMMALELGDRVSRHHQTTQQLGRPIP